MQAPPLFQVRNLQKKYPIKSGVFRRTVGHLSLINGIDFEVHQGETVALVMPEDSGKTVLARTLVQLEQASAGQVLFNGRNVAKLKRADQQQVRRQMQMIFEDPYMAINPRLKIADIVGEPLSIHRLASGEAKNERVKDLLATVGLNSYMARRFPFEFSGGQRQKVVLARALATEPSFLLFDDLFAQLDPLLIRPFISLLNDLKKSLNLTYLSITSNIAEVADFADRVAIFYLGEIVEMVDTATLFSQPAHPYTQYLLSQIPLEDLDLEEKRQPIQVKGRYPDVLHPPKACHFHPRCPYTSDICKAEKPELRALNTAVSTHQVACHHAERFFE